MSNGTLLQPTVTQPLVNCPPPNSSSRPLSNEYLSFSRIRTYQGCSLRYYFRYVASLREETVSASLVFELAIHAAIQHHFQELLAGNKEDDSFKLYALAPGSVLRLRPSTTAAMAWQIRAADRWAALCHLCSD